MLTVMTGWLDDCICRLGLYREAEKQFRSALNHQEFVDTYLYLAKVKKLIPVNLFILHTPNNRNI